MEKLEVADVLLEVIMIPAVKSAENTFCLGDVTRPDSSSSPFSKFLPLMITNIRSKDKYVQQADVLRLLGKRENWRIYLDWQEVQPIMKLH